MSESNGVRNALIAAIVVFAVGIGGGLAYIVHRSAATSSAGAPDRHAVTRTASPAPPTPARSGPATSHPAAAPTAGAQSPAPTSDAEAVRLLDDWATADAARSPLNGRWQVVLGSKYVGLRDPKQQAAPFTAIDIWRQFQGYRRQFSADAGSFRVLRSSYYGDQRHLRGRTYWVAILMLNLGSRAEATGWCEDRFHQSGKALEEHCIEARFVAPHD